MTAAAFGGGREWGLSESRSPSQSESLIESFCNAIAAKMLSMITVIFRCEDEEKGLAESGGEDDVQKHSEYKLGLNTERTLNYFATHFATHICNILCPPQTRQ